MDPSEKRWRIEEGLIENGQPTIKIDYPFVPLRVIGLINRSPWVTKLELWELTQLAVTNLQFLFEALETNTTITTLELKWFELSESGATALVRLIRANQTIMSLNAGYVRLQQTGQLRDFCSAVAVNRGLRRLNLMGNLMVGEGKWIAQILRNPTLRSLDLENCDLSDSAIHIATALRMNTTLERLVLKNNGWHARTANAFVHMFDENFTLIELEMGHDAYAPLIDRNRTLAFRRNAALIMLMAGPPAFRTRGVSAAVAMFDDPLRR